MNQTSIHALLVSGLGQLHTNEPDTKKPKKRLTPYLTIIFETISHLVDHPQKVDKTQAQWLIASTLPSRIHKEQEAQGEFWLLWGDLDKHPPSLPDLVSIVEAILGGCDFEIYNSRSATAENQKARILIFLDKPLCFADWRSAQEILNDKFAALGIEPDRANQRAAQLCYLPNRGVFYGSLSRRTGNIFTPLQAWHSEIMAKRKAIEAQRVALETAKQAAMVRRQALSLSAHPSIFEAFNAAYTPHEWMIKAGYDQRGDSFRHPNSETGNYSATVRLDDNGVLRVHTLSTADTLHTNGAGAHDAFSTFCTLFHGGDTRAAKIDAGDNLLAIGCLSYNRAVQIEHERNKAAQHTETSPTPLIPPMLQARQEADAYYSTMPDYEAKPVPKVPFTMSSFTLSGSSEKMKTKMLADRYVLDRIAILGQATTIYAKPNTGKTLLVLWMLIESIKAGHINGKNVFYINADDDYKGLVFKTSLAEQYGFEMLAPGHNGFESAAMQGYMRQMIDDDTARGVIIILDTLKKFTDLMSKKLGSEFMNRAREFVAHGGTLIMLAHTNKNRDANGKVVFGGTSDVPDDCDCVYLLDEVAKTTTTKQVLFENIKNRGVVANEMAFGYSVEEGKHYQELLDSVERADKASTERAYQDKQAMIKREKDKAAITALTEAIRGGSTQKLELIKAACEDSAISRRRLISVLEDYLDDIWGVTIGDKNTRDYHLIDKKPATAKDYISAKNGE